jgi:hypothetical protein
MLRDLAIFVIEFPQESCGGDRVKKIAACVLLIPLGLALSLPPVAYASSNSGRGAAQTDSTKSRKAYLKQQKKQQKKFKKSQRKVQKDSDKLHPDHN